MLTAKQVANFFIRKSFHENDPSYSVTPLKLQKLVYYAQAWYATLNGGNKLFRDRIEAWVHGPVVPKLYQEYRDYGYNPIDRYEPNEIKLNDDIKALLESVWNAYGKYDAKELEKLTHLEDPWREARKNLPVYQPSENEITLKSMVNYFNQFRVSGVN